MPGKKTERFFVFLFLCLFVSGFHFPAQAAVSKTSKRIMRPSAVAAVVSDLSAAALSTASIRWSWSTATLSGYDGFHIYLSTKPGLLISSATLAADVTYYIDAGLEADKAYTRWITAYQAAEEGSDSEHIEKYTYALPPAMIAISSMTPVFPPDPPILPPYIIRAGSTTADSLYVEIPPAYWFPNPVRATAYVIESSTNGGADYVRSRSFFVPWQTIPLLSNRRYMIRMAAVNGDNEVTPGVYSATRTFTTPPLNVSSFTALARSSFTVEWQWPADRFAGTGITGFRIYRSTSTADEAIPSDGLPGEIVQTLGPGASFWTEVFVSSDTPTANSRHTRWIKAFGFLESQEISLFQKYTYAVAPATCTVEYYDPYPYLVAHVTENSLTPTWYVWPSTTGPGIGIASSFVIDYSTVAGFAVAVSSTIVGGPPQTVSGLTSNTKYDLRIGAINGDNQQTPDNALNPFAYSKAYKIITRPAPPSAFSCISWTDTALNCTWSTATYANPSYIDGYSIGDKHYAVIGGVSVVYWSPLDFLAGVESRQYSLDYLLTNSTHTLTLWASQTDPDWASHGFDPDWYYNNYGSYGLDYTGSTFATPPNDVAFDTITARSIGTWWQEPEVPATKYLVERSTTLGGKGPWVVISSVTGNHFNDTGLTPSTTYSYRIGAINLLGIQTLGLAEATSGYRRDYSFVRSTMTVQRSPTLYAAATGTSTINWNWTNDVSGVLVYNMYTATDGIIMPNLAAGDTYWIEANLSSANARYTRRIRSVTPAGTSDYSEASAATLAVNPSTLTVTAFGLHSLTIEWSGNGASRYKIDRSSDMNAWAALKTWSDVYVSTSFTDTYLRLATTYYYAVSGYNQDGVLTLASATYSGLSRTLDLPAAMVQIFSTAAVAQSTTVALSGGRITVALPAGAAPSDGYISVSTSAATNPVGVTKAGLDAATAKLLPSRVVGGSIAELYFYDLYGATFTGNFALPPRITIAYADANGDDFVDGTSPQISAGTLKLLNLDTANLVWNFLAASRLDRAARTVYADVSRFSFYALGSFLPLGGTMAGVYAYPNPYKPGSGGDFDQSVFGDGIVFEGLTARAKLRIFNVAGGLVAELNDEDGDGRAFWNARNKNGERVASGLYIWLATNPDDSGDKKSGKITIIK